MMRHAAEVDSSAFLTHVLYFLDVDRAELVLDTLRLAGRKLATRFDHVDTYFLFLPTHDIDYAEEFSCRVGWSQKIIFLIVFASCKFVHCDGQGQELRLCEKVALDIGLHVAASELVLLVAHNSDGCVGAEKYLVMFIVKHEYSFLHLVNKMKIILLLTLHLSLNSCCASDSHCDSNEDSHDDENQREAISHVLCIHCLVPDIRELTECYPCDHYGQANEIL